VIIINVDKSPWKTSARNVHSSEINSEVLL
jgi:hypothetical protein